MDIGRAFSYVFEDERWVNKVLIGALFVLLGVIVYAVFWGVGALLTMLVRVPIGIILGAAGSLGMLFTVGYMIDVVRSVADGHARPLPEWTQLEDKARKGLTFLLAALVYAIPTILITLCTGITSLADSGRYSPSGPVVAVQLIGACLNILYALFLLIITPAIVVQFAINGTFAACFQFARIIDFITTRLGDYFITIVIMIAAGIVGLIATIITCGLGFFPISFYAQATIGHLCGQLARRPSGGALQGPGAS